MPDRVGLPNSLPLRYAGPGVDLIPIKRFPRNPTTTDKRYPVGQFAILGENPSSGNAGDLWYLSEFTGGDAIWLPLTGGGSGCVVSLSDTADTKTYSDATGNIKLNGSTGIIITSDPGNNTIDFTTPGGGPPIEEVVVDAATAPGVSPVVPSGTGQITVSGAAVANHSVPLETHTRAVNAYNIEIQYAAAAAATDATKSGVAHFNSSQFSVDANGFVELSGGGIALDSLGVQATSGTGTNPVLPDGTGKIEIEGALVAAGTNPVQSESTAANTLQIQVQTSQALAAADSTKTGLSNFSSNDFVVDSNGFVQAIGSAGTGTKNIAFSYSGGTFTVHGSDGTALSATNPGYVTLQSKGSPCQLVTIAVTANQTFIDDAGASTIIGNLFGLTTSIAASVDIPFFLYAVSNDDEDAISFMISRFPNTPVSPTSAKIGKTGSAVANSQGSFFALGDPTVTSYDQNPCLSIGCFRMQMSASDDWTVQTLGDDDGLGKFFEQTQFNVPLGQFGNASGRYTKGNGPTFGGSYNSVYKITRNNYLNFYGIFANVTANGTDSNALNMGSPYLIFGAVKGRGYAITNAANSLVCLARGTPGNNNDTNLYYHTTASANATINNDSFSVSATNEIHWNSDAPIAFV